MRKSWSILLSFPAPAVYASYNTCQHHLNPIVKNKKITNLFGKSVWGNKDKMKRF